MRCYNNKKGKEIDILMKKITVFLLAIVMLLSFGLTAYGAETTTSETNKAGAAIESSGVITPNAWYYSYTKTVTKYYIILSDIPDSIYYSEYNSGVGAECSGYLDLQSVTVVYDGYKAVFKGTIGAYIF